MTFSLYHSDCFDVFSGMESKSVDLVICDLPYGTTNCAWDCPLDLKKLWGQYSRICRGAVILFAQSPFDKVLGMSNLNDLKYEWIWEKSHGTGHLNAKRCPIKTHENILVFGKVRTYCPQKTSGHPRKTATKRGDESTVYGKQSSSPIIYDSTERYPRDVIRFPMDKQTAALHPTQKPLALLEYLVATYSNPHDIVMDNCMGSGTTGVACRSLGRQFIGIEKDQSYFDIAKARIELGSTKPLLKPPAIQKEG